MRGRGGLVQVEERRSAMWEEGGRGRGRKARARPVEPRRDVPRPRGPASSSAELRQRLHRHHPSHTMQARAHWTAREVDEKRKADKEKASSPCSPRSTRLDGALAPLHSLHDAPPVHDTTLPLLTGRPVERQAPSWRPRARPRSCSLDGRRRAEWALPTAVCWSSTSKMSVSMTRRRRRARVALDRRARRASRLAAAVGALQRA